MDLKKKKYKFWLDLYYTNILLRIFFLRVESYSILNSRIFLAIQFLSLRSKLTRINLDYYLKRNFSGYNRYFVSFLERFYELLRIKLIFSFTGNSRPLINQLAMPIRRIREREISGSNSDAQLNILHTWIIIGISCNLAITIETVFVFVSHTSL